MQYIRIIKPDGRELFRPYSTKTLALIQRANNLMNEGHKDKIEVVTAKVINGEYIDVQVVNTLHKGSKSVKTMLSEKDAEIMKLREELERMKGEEVEEKKVRKSKKQSDVTE